MSIINDLLKRIAHHCEKRSISPSTFGRMVVNDGKLVANLKAGRTITVATAEKVGKYLDEQEAEPAE